MLFIFLMNYLYLLKVQGHSKNIKWNFGLNEIGENNMSNTCHVLIYIIVFKINEIIIIICIKNKTNSRQDKIVIQHQSVLL